MNTKTLPAGVGKVIQDDEPGNFKVQTPDRLWSVMFERMKAQVAARTAELSAWEYHQQRRQPGAHANAWYWEAYKAEKAKHRVDYPMPWGHVMFRKS